MGRINVRVDEDLLEEVDSQGDVRSDVVRNALKQYLGKEDVRQEEQELADVVESVVDRKIENDIYPRLGNIYDRLEDEKEGEEEEAVVEIQTSVNAEVRDFYEGYTRAFETTVGDVVAELLEEHAREKSAELHDVSPTDPSWTLDTEEAEKETKEAEQ
jgi:metal-responsive CopG/Arc/MetJ family transcriptional regulator